EPHHPRDVELLDLDAALSELATIDPRKSRVAELRFFGGLSLAETSRVVDISVATVEREWRAPPPWLYRPFQGRRGSWAPTAGALARARRDFAGGTGPQHRRACGIRHRALWRGRRAARRRELDAGRPP